MSLQAKLLRVLENKTITPLGAEKDVKIDIRLVSATNQPLETAIRDGGFREDLFYRLNVFPITLPPLRDRREDVADISRHFFSGWGRPLADLTDEALAKLARHDWPGNIRELRNVLERATIIRPEGSVSEDDILLTDTAEIGRSTAAGPPPDTLDLNELEKAAILRALDAAAGNKSEAARLLGITRRALYGRLERYGIE